MKKLATAIYGLFVLESIPYNDIRGSFQKLFNADWFKENGFESDFKEFYYSVSYRNVIRGMHFQKPPYQHAKLVYLTAGAIVDVVVDLRLNSPTYKQHYSIELNFPSAQYVYIPAGCAHGFLSLADNTIVNYAQTSVYNAEADGGIAYNSFGFDWNVEKPIISGRDLTFASLDNFKTPFK